VEGSIVATTSQKTNRTTKINLYKYTWSMLTINNHILMFIYLLWEHCHIPSPLIWKLHPCSDIIFQLYKPAFYSSHLSCNMPYCSIATIQVFCLLQWRYSFWLGLPWWSYSCQCLNTETFTQGNRGYPTETPSTSYSRNSYIRLVVTL